MTLRHVKPRVERVCTFCGEPIETASMPRVRVTEHFDTYDSGRRIALYHPECWQIIEAASPLVRTLMRLWEREVKRA